MNNTATAPNQMYIAVLTAGDALPIIPAVPGVPYVRVAPSVDALPAIPIESLATLLNFREPLRDRAGWNQLGDDRVQRVR